MVIVYSKPACVQCTATYRALERHGIEYVVVDVTQNDAALEYISEDLGYFQAPVVLVDDNNHWSGFRPDLIDLLAKAMRSGVTA
ncbi:glutaredoxin-like protein NrdH [Subtercola vilae]|uniref:Glutaredoxin-like protein NrdH n=1 Tax=Subtercola vilae TaxID=2056433 RepID=A0A4T2B8M6_9MICO|nr:glutaredoxin-like protein NrdH [Subtercola vilae]TIH26669.1 glutaredoxin-like protein NrdH [Subtercola vilae]